MQDTIKVEGCRIVLEGFSKIQDEVTFNFLPNSVTIIPGFYSGNISFQFPVLLENGKKVVKVDKEIAKQLKAIEGISMLYHNGIYYPLL